MSGFAPIEVVYSVSLAAHVSGIDRAANDEELVEEILGGCFMLC